MIDLARCRLTPLAHQIVGVTRLVRDTHVLLADEVGMMKSAQVVTSACHLAEAGLVDTLLVVCPNYARSVWVSPDPLLGEVAKHAWFGTRYSLHDFSAATPRLPARNDRDHLQVVVTNYELVRRDNHLATLREWLKARRAWLVVDESWMVNNPTAAQTKAVGRLADRCDRVTLLNGTPGAPEQVYSQITILDPRAYPVKNWFHWKARYTRAGGFQGKAIVGYREDTTPERVKIEARFILRREAKDCLDLPPATHTTFEARLTPKTWALYGAMRDEFVAWLSSHEAAVATQAGVKAMRLQQILAGFVGGVEQDDQLTLEGPAPSTIREVGREKLDVIQSVLDSRARLKTLIWCKFRPEMARMAAELRKAGHRVFMLWGQQAPAERDEAKRVFAPGSPDTEGAVLIGHEAAGGAGLNFSGADLALYATISASIIRRAQSEGRVLRPGQTQRVVFGDVLATGPQGQKTVDHALTAALRKKEDVSAWTIDQWRLAMQ